jgi:E3 ubiquitin-protein ligase TRIP12
MAEILMEKLPELYRQHFLKEGVAHAIQQLASAPPPEPPAAAVTTGAPAAASTRGRRSSGRPASRAADKDGGEAGKAAVEDARTPAGDTLRAAVGARARRFHARHFTDGEGVAVGEPAAEDSRGAGRRCKPCHAAQTSLGTWLPWLLSTCATFSMPLA